jgi:hypothetical protein
MMTSFVKGLPSYLVKGGSVTTREDMIDRIIEAEWKMFQAVSNIGGKAACQDDWKTFRIMRAGQSASWPDAMLESYLDDISEAERSGRNLLTEKYARMMRSTSPLEYGRMKHLLPTVDPNAVELIEQIVKTILEWEQELLEKYPYIFKRRRPLFSTADSAGVTSMETYLRGELATYSLRTLELYLDHIQKEQSQNINGSAITLLSMIKQYGFASLEEANETIESRNLPLS